MKKNKTKCTGACGPSAPIHLPESRREADEQLATLSNAIAHPMRVRILHILARKTSCVCGDIVSELRLTQSTFSEHLRILKAAGLIIGEVDGPRVCYCINVETLGQFKNLVLELPCPETALSEAKCQEDYNG